MTSLCPLGVIGLLGFALALTAVVLLLASDTPSTVGIGREPFAVCAVAGRDGSVIVGVTDRKGSVDVCSVAMMCEVMCVILRGVLRDVSGDVMCGSDGCGCSPRKTSDGKKNDYVFAST